MKKRQRLDTTVVERGLAPSREKARALILAGDVLVGGQPELRAAALVADDAVIEVAQPARFVSRGGEKLDHALTRFGIEVSGLKNDSVLYFRVPDINAATAELESRGVKFVSAPHMIFKHPDGMEEWMAFFEDCDGGVLSIMSQVRS